MQYSKMYYIQRYGKCERPEKDKTSRFLQGAYMGSAEFEFGSVQKSWRFLRENDIGLYRVVSTIESMDAKTKKELPKQEKVFFVITTKQGLARFKEKIGEHLAGDRLGRVAKEWTGIREKFITGDTSSLFQKIDLWLDVSAYVDYGSEYRPAPDYNHPCAFTGDEQLARRLFLELFSSKDEFATSRLQYNRENLRIGDMVITYLSDDPVKVVGLNADDSISVKINKYGKAIKLDARDVYPIEGKVDEVSGENAAS